MTSYELYTLFLCIFVFIGFTAVFSILIVWLLNTYIRLVDTGAEDEKIKIEYEKAAEKKSKRLDYVVGCVSWALSIAISVFAVVSFVVSVTINANEVDRVQGMPDVKVVMSGSMATQHEKNTYLFRNDLNNQLQTFDLIFLHELPPEDELAQYDIVAYEKDGVLILHRIVNIEEPNEKHPEKRYFLLQGDAVPNHDEFPVLYEDMRGIYRDGRIPMVGSFFLFMRSPGGILCILLILAGTIVTPIAEKKIKDAKDRRYALMCPPPEEPVAEPVVETPTEAPTPSPNLFNSQALQRKDIQEFRASIVNAGEQTKEYYVSLCNYIQGMGAVKTGYSKTYQTVRLNGDPLIRLAIRGGFLSVVLALPPEEHEDDAGAFVDLSKKNGATVWKMLVKIDSDQKLELVKKLLASKTEK